MRRSAGAFPEPTTYLAFPPDTRSFAEVFLHVVGERHGFLSTMGANFLWQFKERVRQIHDRKESHHRGAESILGFREQGDQWHEQRGFRKAAAKARPQSQSRATLFTSSLLTRTNTSARSVAYARQNGIVPP